MAQDNANLPNKLLIIDDDAQVAGAIQDQLSRFGIAIVKATNYETAMYQFNQMRWDVVVIEQDFEPLKGLSMIQKWRTHEMIEKRDTSFVVMTSGKERSATVESLAREMGGIEFISKPFSAVQLLPLLSRGLLQKQRNVQFRELKSKLVEPFVKHGNLDKAVEQVQKRLPELGAKGLVMLCELQEKAKNYDQALTIVSGMLDKDQNNISYINTKARLLMRMQRYGEARELMERADKLAPENIDRLVEMSTMYLHLQEPDKSVAKMKEVLAMHPEAPDMKFDMFGKLSDHGFDSHAVEFGRATCSPLEIVKHYNNKGVMISKSGETQKAVEEYQRALKFFPKYKENYRIMYNIALAKAQSKDRKALEEAAELLKKSLQLEPEFDKAKKTLEQVTKMLEAKDVKAAS